MGGHGRGDKDHNSQYLKSRVHGVHQIEPAAATDDGPGESRLLLVSIGLQQTDPNVPALSIPSLVENIVARLTVSGASGLVDEFLKRVLCNGSESGIGYEHATMAQGGSVHNHV